jgi:hypothetical protein
MFVMALATFIAYPFLSGNDRKQVAPLATQMDDPVDDDELDDDGEPVMMDDDEDNYMSDQQIDKGNQNINRPASDPQIKNENQNTKSSASDPQMRRGVDDEVSD